MDKFSHVSPAIRSDSPLERESSPDCNSTGLERDIRVCFASSRSGREIPDSRLEVRGGGLSVYLAPGTVVETLGDGQLVSTSQVIHKQSHNTSCSLANSSPADDWVNLCTDRPTFSKPNTNFMKADMGRLEKLHGCASKDHSLTKE